MAELLRPTGLAAVDGIEATLDRRWRQGLHQPLCKPLCIKREGGSPSRIPIIGSWPYASSV